MKFSWNLNEKARIVCLNVGKAIYLFIWALVFGVSRNEVRENCSGEGSKLFKVITWDSVAGGLFYLILNLPWQLVWLNRLNCSREEPENSQAAERRRAVFAKVDIMMEIAFIALVFTNIVIAAVGTRSTSTEICKQLMDKRFFAFILLSGGLLVVLVARLVYKKRCGLSGEDCQKDQNIAINEADPNEVRQSEEALASTNAGHRTVKQEQKKLNISKKKTSPKSCKAVQNIPGRPLENITDEDEKDLPESESIEKAGSILDEKEQDGRETNQNEICLDVGLFDGEEKHRKDVEAVVKFDDDADSQINRPLDAKLPTDHRHRISKSLQDEEELEKLRFKEAIDKKTERMAKMIFKDPVIRKEDQSTRLSPFQHNSIEKHNNLKTKENSRRQSEPLFEGEQGDVESRYQNLNKTSKETLAEPFISRPIIKKKSLPALSSKEGYLKNPLKRAAKAKKRVTFGGDEIISYSKNKS